MSVSMRFRSFVCGRDGMQETSDANELKRKFCARFEVFVSCDW